jgi:hypothetical protein
MSGEERPLAQCPGDPAAGTLSEELTGRPASQKGECDLLNFLAFGIRQVPRKPGLHFEQQFGDFNVWQKGMRIS